MMWIVGGFVALILVAVVGAILTGWPFALAVLAGAALTGYCIGKFEDSIEGGF